MKIICWNIQKLNINKAAGRRGDIASAVAAAANGEPFILFVLEARQNAQNALGYFAICVGGLVSGHARRPPDVVV